jgi:anti-sigma regulatory factor (Ser/Thr protein kinase)
MDGTRADAAAGRLRATLDAGDGSPWLDLASTPVAAGQARAWTRAMLAAWNLGHLADDAELVVSELVTNAVRASSAAGSKDPVRVCVTAIGTRLLIQVRDSCPVFPVRKRSDITDEDGRGLMIVDHVAAEVGCHRTPGMPGKVVWCLIAEDAAPGTWMDGWPH